MSAEGLRLYSYWRSSAAYRVRIALNLKGLVYETIPVHLTENGGEQHNADYQELNPQEMVPMLRDGGRIVRQSMAIIEYLDETYESGGKLLPATARDRARVRGLAQVVACDIHPLNNLRVLQYLKNTLGTSDEQKDGWYKYWIDVGLEALETRLARDPATGRFCHGDTPTLADICLVPQLANARRMNLDISPFAALMRIEAACLALPAFIAAAPAAQPDAE